jgi:hypothetical protein
MMDLYFHPMSPPSLTVLLLAKTIGVELNLKEIELWTQPQEKKDEFKKV